MIKKTVAKKLKEYGAIIGNVLLFFAAQYVLRWIDPTAGTYDAGVLQSINLSLVKAAVCFSCGWLAFSAFWPDQKAYLKTLFNHEFKNLNEWQKVKISCGLLLFYVACIVLLNLVSA